MTRRPSGRTQGAPSRPEVTAGQASPRIVGIDEAGRGCWAGPVVAAAFLPCGSMPPDVRDSKKLSAGARERLFTELTAHHRWAVGTASAAEIDELNILQATFLAMRRAFQGLGVVSAAEVIIDGNQNPRLDTTLSVRTLVKADDLVQEVGAASIIAKHWRDTCLQELDSKYPGYGFARHMGYGVPQHAAALAAKGPCPEHRATFKPVKAATRT